MEPVARTQARDTDGMGLRNGCGLNTECKTSNRGWIHRSESSRTCGRSNECRPTSGNGVALLRTAEKARRVRLRQAVSAAA